MHNIWHCTDAILIQFRLYLYTVARHMAQWQKNCVKGEWLTLRRYQMCRWEDEQQTRPGRKGWKVMLMWQSKLDYVPPQTSYNYCHLINFLYLVLSLVAKCMQLAHAHPTMSCIHLSTVCTNPPHFWLSQYCQILQALNGHKCQHHLLLLLAITNYHVVCHWAWFRGMITRRHPFWQPAIGKYRAYRVQEQWILLQGLKT